MLDKQRYATHKQRKAILQRDGYKCRYCQVKVTLQTCNIDHVKPWKYGGKTVAKNLVTCCQPCNKLKLNQRLIEPLRLTTISGKTRWPDAIAHKRVGCKKPDCMRRHHDLRPMINPDDITPWLTDSDALERARIAAYY